MSLRAIAKELEISSAYLSYMINGKRPWRSDLYDRYRQVVNTRIDSVNTSDVVSDTKKRARSVRYLHGVQEGRPFESGRPDQNPEISLIHA